MWNKFKATVEEHAIWLLMVVPVGYFVFSMIRTLSDDNSMVMDIAYGILSSLIGAFVGGFCSLAASIYVGDQQMKATVQYEANIKLRETYYLPIYLEIIEIEEKLAEKTAYCESLMCEEWENIRKISTVLGIPKSLVNSLDKMQDSFSLYSENRLDAKYRTEYLKEVKKAKKTLEETIKKINKV